MKIFLLISHDLDQQHTLNGLYTLCAMSDEQTLKIAKESKCSCLDIYLFLDSGNKVHYIVSEKGTRQFVKRETSVIVV